MEPSTPNTSVSRFTYIATLVAIGSLLVALLIFYRNESVGINLITWPNVTISVTENLTSVTENLTSVTENVTSVPENFTSAAVVEDAYPRILAVILAEMRSSDLTWTKFQENVLAPLKADLAVCVSDRSPPDDPFVKAAKYKWFHEEPSDWATAFDEACKCHDCWRIVLQIKSQLFGGILDDNYQHMGSAAILIFYRWFLLQNLKSSRADETYDYFIVTRSDYYFVSPHPRPVNTSDPSLIWIPQGEDYGGITDRHIFVPRLHLHAALSLMDPIIENPQGLYDDMKYGSSWNLEGYIKFIFERRGILTFVRRFPRVMFAVRSPNASTRWSVGKWNEEVGMTVKYDTEYTLTKASTPLLELP